MRILVAAARFPALGGKGDQSRSFSFIRHLAGQGHEVTVVTSGSPPSAADAVRLRELARVEEVAASFARRLSSAVMAAATGTPAQVGWMMPRRTWRRVRAAGESCDVALVVTARAMRGEIALPVLLDHVDALSLNMSRRARGTERPHRRAAAAVEARLMRRHERRLAGLSAAQAVTSAEDASHLPGRPKPNVIPVAWEGVADRAVLDGERDIDVVLSGNMAYPPNVDAARFLARHVLPLLRGERADSSVWIVGRAADRLDLDGIQVASDVPDLSAFLRRAKVAVVPLRIGTGSPFKLLEAAAAGAAVVATPAAAERFDIPVRTATGAEGFVRAISALLDDERARRAQAEAALDALAGHSAEAAGARIEDLLRGLA